MYPTIEDTTFIVCNDVKSSGHGTHDIIGLCPGGVIVIPNEYRPDGALRRVTFFIDFKGLAPATYSMDVAVKSPGGTIIFDSKSEMNVPQATGITPNPFSAIFSVEPFPIESGGTHSVSLTIDGHEYKWDFQILFVPQLKGAPPFKPATNVA